MAYVEEAIRNGHISGNGAFTKRAEELLQDMHQGSSALLTTSCTHALEMSARLLNLQPGDEVIVPSYTFVSSASAFLWNGARPVFADVRQDTLNLDPSSVEALISSRTKAICLVHYAGVGADPEQFAEMADHFKLALIEDNAHGLGAKFRGKTLGTFGSLSTLSFHETKNVTCGEGGALVVNDPQLLPRAEILREKGTDRLRFLRGQVDKYTWTDIGSSWVMSELLAAVLVGQLERFSEIQQHRRQLWLRYSNELEEWSRVNDVALPTIPSEAEHSAHMFFLQMPTKESRDSFIRHMHDSSIQCVFHYQSLHSSPQGRRLGENLSCPVSDYASQRVVRLPLYSGLSFEDQTMILASILRYTT